MRCLCFKLGDYIRNGRVAGLPGDSIEIEAEQGGVQARWTPVIGASRPAWPPPTTITSKVSVGAALKLIRSLSAPLSCSEIVPYRRKTHGHGDGDS